jgi:hypothetical protein
VRIRSRAALAFVGAAAVVASLLPAAGAHAQGPDGPSHMVFAEISRAHAKPSWTHGSVFGSIRFNCAQESFGLGSCGTWQPYLEVDPINSGDEPSDRCEPGFGRVTIWEGQPQTTSGTQTFSLPKVALATKKGKGIVGQTLCPGYNLRIADCDSPLIWVCNTGGNFAPRDFAGRNPCKGKRKNRLAHAAGKFHTPDSYRKKFCPGK